MTDDDRLDPQLLGAYDVPEPASDLTDRFMERQRGGQPAGIAVEVAPSRKRWAYVAGGAVLAAAVVTLLLLLRHTPLVEQADGHWSATSRTTEKIGERGVAVVEAGGSIAWQLADRSARVRQDRGDVFYRVERSDDPFEVTTAHAVVRARGTCFRIVLETYGTTVTVYEGTVEIANAHGQILVTAGEQALATTDAPPRMLSGPTLVAPPVVAASPVELLARDRAQRERIVALEAQVATLARTNETIGTAVASRRPWELSRLELSNLAERCMAPHDIQPFAGSTVIDGILENGEQSLSFTADERAAVVRVIERTQPAYQEGLRKLYAELTGESGAALDPMALILEITSKSPAADTSVAFKRVATERLAGVVRPTADAKSSVVERYVRFSIASANAFESQLAGEIGNDRARAFRRTWGMVNLAPGCPDQESP